MLHFRLYDAEKNGATMGKWERKHEVGKVYMVYAVYTFEDFVLASRTHEGNEW